MMGRWLLFACCGLLMPLDSRSQALLQYSADITRDLAGVGHDHDYFLGTPAASARVALAGMPEQADLDALHVETDSSVLLSLDVAASVGGITARPADVVRYRGGAYEMVFDATANGVPDGVNCDAVSRDPSGRLLLSFDRGFAAGGATIYRADVVAFDNGAFVKVLESGGLADGLNVDALHAESATVLLVSFDTGGVLAGVAFADEDILAINLATFGWSLRHDMSETSSLWGPADLDALSVASLGDEIFGDSFE